MIGGRIEKIGIVGAGAWGTALAQTAARAGRDVLIWGRDREVVAAINRDRRNPRHLPDVTLESGVSATADIADLADVDALLLVVPAQSVRQVCRSLGPVRVVMVVCAKGLERATGSRLSDVVAAECPDAAVATLSGPSFAAEVARNLPTAVTLGCSDAALGERLAEALSHETFRVYWTDDIVGVEIGGAVKNVLAIAAGVVTGAGLGENARAALITRGLAELGRFGEALGARRETLMGLSGLGDLMLTATSLTSRNTAYGYALARGDKPADTGARPLAEGAFTAAAVVREAERVGVETPICAAVDDILAGRIDIAAAMSRLLRRPLKMEAYA